MSVFATDYVPSPVEPSSLVPAHKLDSRVLHLANIPVDLPLIDYFLDILTLAVAGALYAEPHRVAFQLKTTSLASFVSNIVHKANLDAKTIITAIIYMTRMKEEVVAADNVPWLCHRLAVSAFMCAHKHNNDAQLPLTIWERAAQHFKKRDINKMENHFMHNLVEYRLELTEADMLAHYDAVMVRYAAHSEAQKVLAAPSIFPHVQPAEPRIVLESIEDLPDLCYPDSDSPMSESDDFVSDDDDSVNDASGSYSSDGSPEVITPPDSKPAAHVHMQSSSTKFAEGPVPVHTRIPEKAVEQPKTHLNPNPYHCPPRAQPVVLPDDTLDAMVRFYAADRGRITKDPSGSPRYIPYSPSFVNTDTDTGPQPRPPSQAQPERMSLPVVAPEDVEKRRSQLPWRKAPQPLWPSTMSRDQTWGCSGLPCSKSAGWAHVPSLSLTSSSSRAFRVA
ncbi:hypothetical protein C8Q80DRAFT_558830 [Daedaleopsis nitida]|nr:hypothetical protein C8Q80DRAFT_558830 [Daedaleopsis nitida]